MQHADDGYSRLGNFGGSPDHNMFLIYLPAGINVGAYITHFQLFVLADRILLHSKIGHWHHHVVRLSVCL